MVRSETSAERRDCSGGRWLPEFERVTQFAQRIGSQDVEQGLLIREVAIRRRGDTPARAPTSRSVTASTPPISSNARLHRAATAGRRAVSDRLASAGA